MHGTFSTNFPDELVSFQHVPVYLAFSSCGEFIPSVGLLNSTNTIASIASIGRYAVMRRATGLPGFRGVVRAPVYTFGSRLAGPGMRSSCCRALRLRSRNGPAMKMAIGPQIPMVAVMC